MAGRHYKAGPGSSISIALDLNHRMAKESKDQSKKNVKASRQVKEPNKSLYPVVAGSSRQGCNPAGESPAMIIV